MFSTKNIFMNLFIWLILSISFMVVCLIQKKDLKTELTFEIIRSMQIVSILLLAFGILMCFLCIGIFIVPFPIIAIILTSNARKLISVGKIGAVKARINTASILNVIASAFCCMGVIFIGIVCMLLSNIGGV